MAVNGDHKSAYGTGKNKGKLKKTLSNFGSPASSQGKATWTEAHPNKVRAIVDVVTDLGGAVMFGKSRDGGALSVTVFMDGDKRTIWIGGDDDLEERLDYIREYFVEQA